MLKDFKQFIIRGNVVDLATAVVIGAAFTGVVNALVTNIITPLIAAIISTPDFAKLSFTIGRSVFSYGLFFNALVTFLITATVIFFFVVQPANRLMHIVKGDTPVVPTTRPCPFCRSDIPCDASRCKFCTSKVEPQKTTQALEEKIKNA